MPTVISHAVVGASLSVLAPNDIPRWRLAIVLATLPILPDLDVIGFSLGIDYGHPFGHRGFTHSLLFAFLLAAILPSLIFRSIPLLSRSWFLLVSLLFTATASHGVLDAFTDAGLGVGFFIPFDNDRYFFPWRPIDTSPLSISAFFNGPALRILWSELVWIGTPLVVLVSTVLIIRRGGR